MKHSNFDVDERKGRGAVMEMERGVEPALGMIANVGTPQLQVNQTGEPAGLGGRRIYTILLVCTRLYNYYIRQGCPYQCSYAHSR